VHWVVWPAALGCLIGTWLLTGAGQLDLNVGDLWVLGTVIPFTLHVLWVGGLAERLHAPLLVAWGQFIVCGVLALLFSLPLETFDWNNLSKVFWPLAYMVFISVGIGFTGQVIGQRYARPAEAAIILSGETVFAALAGALFLSERLTWYGYLGGALIAAGIVIVQILPEPKKPPVAEPFSL
jgi:drug/metabolite transporter (DMT)-like permease